MVCAFIVHTLVPGTCRVLYSSVFTGDSGQNAEIIEGIQSENPETEDPRIHRKKWLLHIANRIHSEYSFRIKGAKQPSYEQQLLNLQNEGTLPEFELGFFRTKPTDHYDKPPTNAETFPESRRDSDKVVVWLGALNCGFALVCERVENRIAAENVLKIMIRYLHEHVKVLTQPSEVILKVDQVASVVRQFLPGGRILPMNHRLIRQFERELDSDLKQQ